MGRNERIVEALIQLKGLLPAQSAVTPGALKLYARALEDIPEDAVMTAIAKAATSERFFPVPADLRRLAGVAPVQDRASAAWEEVVSAIASVGVYRTPTFDRATADAVNRLGGWVALCGRDRDWLMDWGRKAFLAEYASVAEYGGSGAELHGLHGSRPALPALPPAEGQEYLPPPPEAVDALRKLGLL